MRTIVPPYQEVISLLNFQVASSSCVYKESIFVISVPYDNGILKYNVLTGQLVFLEEQNNDTNELISYWYMVDATKSEQDRCNQIRKWIAENDNKTGINITIFPTTYCNARCAYCFEGKHNQSSMSNSVAKDIINYVIKNFKSKHIILRWFGGEPLMNENAIDEICRGLQNARISYESKMATNGFLFNSSTIAKAKSLWHLKEVQITLDGTEHRYNAIKRYKSQLNVSPFDVVIRNTEELVRGSIETIIRLNISFTNKDDLCKLIDETLIPRYQKCKCVKVYSHILIDEKSRLNNIELINAKSIIDSKLMDAGISIYDELPKSFKTHRCISDDGMSFTISPNGELGLCEHYPTSHFWGHVSNPQILAKEIQFARSYAEQTAFCKECAIYPRCIRLRCCPDEVSCNSTVITNKINNLSYAMIQEYVRWKQTVIKPADLL